VRESIARISLTVFCVRKLQRAPGTKTKKALIQREKDREEKKEDCGLSFLLQRQPYLERKG